MIRKTNGTIYITADAFCDRYNFARRGERFSYATGDLMQACETDGDARALRALVLEMEFSKKIKIEMRERPDIAETRCATSFEYLATKCVMGSRAKSIGSDQREKVPVSA